MKILSKEYKQLKLIGDLINEYLKSPATPVEIRSIELFEIISKHPILKTEFPNNKSFNQFLRKQHQKGVMSSFISYRVDTSNYYFYQWFFRKKQSNINLNPIENITLEGNYNYYKNSKTNIASDGTKLNSIQEVFIYEQFKKCSFFSIKIEYPITIFNESKYPDFIIKNNLSQKEYIWEHFGMTNIENYKSKMADKIEWYKNNGFKTIEEGGNLIYTYYSTDEKLKKEVERIIEFVKS